MRIFLSYSRADQATSELVATNLKQAGHDLFFDRHSIKAAEDFNRVIWSEILKADLFVYLISPNSVRAGSYTLTELMLAEKKWPNPERRVLPVIIESTELSDIPVYASICNILHPKGNVAAEVRVEVNALSKRHRFTQFLRATAIISGMFVIGLFAVMGYLEYLDQRPHAARAKLNVMDRYNEESFIESAYHGDLKMIDLYLTAGMDPNVTSTKGFTALVKAVDGGHFKVVKRLLDAKADVNVQGRSALAWAAGRGNEAMMRAILAAGANSETVNKAFISAANKKNESVLRLLLAHGVGQSTIDKGFVTAAGKANLGVLKFLSDRISDRSKVASDGLLRAVNHFRIDSSRPSQVERIETFNYLLDLGADVNTKDKDGFTPLTGVAFHGNPELAGLLLERGADPDIRCECSGILSGGWTALTLAIKQKGYTSDRDAIIDLLLASGADVNLPRKSRNYLTTPLILAASSNDLQLVRTLLEKGANVNDQNHNGYTALASAATNKEMVTALLGSGGDIHAGTNPLFPLIRQNDYHSMETLLAAGADVNKPNSEGQTPLMIAVKGAHADMVSFLIAAGADVNKSDSEGQTPLMIAVKGGHADMVFFLIEAGARTLDQDKMGRTAEVFAKQRQDYEIINILQNARK